MAALSTTLEGNLKCGRSHVVICALEGFIHYKCVINKTYQLYSIYYNRLQWEVQKTGEGDGHHENRLSQDWGITYLYFGELYKNYAYKPPREGGGRVVVENDVHLH